MQVLFVQLRFPEYKIYYRVECGSYRPKFKFKVIHVPVNMETIFSKVSSVYVCMSHKWRQMHSCTLPRNSREYVSCCNWRWSKTVVGCDSVFLTRTSVCVPYEMNDSLRSSLDWCKGVFLNRWYQWMVKWITWNLFMHSLLILISSTE